MELLCHHYDFLNGVCAKRRRLGAVSYKNWLGGGGGLPSSGRCQYPQQCSQGTVLSEIKPRF
jgi:hypothetical protein